MVNVKLQVNGNMVVYDNASKYKSTVQEVTEDYILINMPIGEGTYYTLQEGVEFEGHYYDGKNYYIFKSYMIGKEKDERNVPLYRIVFPYNVERIQRRQFVRVDFIDYVFLDKKGDGSEWIEGLVLDISGGGIKFSIPVEFEVNEIVKVKVIIKDKVYLLKGKIVRFIEKNGKISVYGLAFMEMKESIREAIIQMVFEQMRKHRDSE